MECLLYLETCAIFFSVSAVALGNHELGKLKLKETSQRKMRSAMMNRGLCASVWKISLPRWSGVGQTCWRGRESHGETGEGFVKLHWPNWIQDYHAITRLSGESTPLARCRSHRSRIHQWRSELPGILKKSGISFFETPLSTSQIVFSVSFR